MSENFTQLLQSGVQGDRAALDQLAPLLYEELRRLARYHLRSERPGHTLQSTALVHEAYLRLVDQREMQWQNRAHFVAIASQMMRRILVDSYRATQTDKRGAGSPKLALDEALGVSDEREWDLSALDDALDALAVLSPEQARVIELRFFGGLAIEEVAAVLGLSRSTVNRYWLAAKAWLYREVSTRGRRDDS